MQLAGIAGVLSGNPVAAFGGLSIGKTMIGLGAATTLGGGAMLMMGPPQRPEEDNGYMAKYNSYLESTSRI